MASASTARARCRYPAAFALLLFAHVADAARTFTELGAERGLDASVASALLVDRDGVLWVGSRAGLFRYDGYQATAYRPDPSDPGSLSDADVRGLYEAHDGALWVATGGGVNRRDPRTGRFTRYQHDPADPRSLTDMSVFCIAQDAAGNVWIGTRSGLNRLAADGRSVVRYRHEPGRATSVAHDWISGLHRGPSAQLWIATVGAGVDRWNASSNGFEHFSLARLAGGSPGFDEVFALQETADGRLWAGTRDGLVVLDPALNKAQLVDLTRDGGPQPIVAALHLDRLGRLWIGTIGHGLLLADPATGAWVRTDEPGGERHAGQLPVQPQISLASTYDSVLVGTRGAGVYRAPQEDLDVRLVARANDGSNPRRRSVTAVLASARAGQPWIGGLDGGPQRVDVTTRSVLPAVRPAPDPIQRAAVLSFAVTADGSHFAGTTEGLYRFAADGSSLGIDRHEPRDPQGIGEGDIIALLPAGSLGLWVGIGGSGLFLRDARSGHFRSFRADSGRRELRSSGHVTALAPDSAGGLWLGTRSDGLKRCRIEPWSCEDFSVGTTGRPGIGRHPVTVLRRDRSGPLWVATDGGGLYRVREDPSGGGVAFERWGEEDGLLSNGVLSLEQDDDGSLWLGTRTGLSRLDPATGRVANLVRQSGLPAGHFNRAASAADERFLYFGSGDGLLSIPRGTPLRTRPPSPVRITGARRLVGGSGIPLSPAELAEGFELRSSDVLALEFAALDYSESAHEYAYRIDDDAWVALGRYPQVTLAGLAPGRHRLEVRGRDVHGQWNTSPPLEFVVVPPLWKTTWFRSSALAAIALLVFGLHRLRVRRLHSRNAVLERLKQQRELALERAEASQRELGEAYAGLRQLMGRLESAKEDERAHISRELHDEFGQTLTAAKINLQMLHRATGDPAVAQRLEDSVNMIDGMIRQARNIALALRPPLLDEAGLVPALDQYLRSLATRTGIGIDFDAGPGVAGIPRGLDTTVFRVAQEAVSNSLRHARPTSIRVTLRSESNALRLAIEDDGAGFDPDAVAQRAKRGEHLGLLGMTERVRNAGGTIVLDSRPGGGSRVDVHIPFEQPASAHDAAPQRDA